MGSNRQGKESLFSCSGLSFQNVGINYINPSDYDLTEFKKQVRHAREEDGVDIVIVFIHWGPNWAWHPSVNICSLAHDFVEAGVNLIFGHSSHHIQVGPDCFQSSSMRRSFRELRFLKACRSFMELEAFWMTLTLI